MDGTDVTDWLLEGDPAIRWQVVRDLVGAPAEQAATEQARVETEGWGARLLDVRDEDGQWVAARASPPTSLRAGGWASNPTSPTASRVPRRCRCSCC